jgi:hypothetical protein
LLGTASGKSLARIGQHWRESGAGDGNRTHGSSLGSLGITIIRRPRKLDSMRLAEVSANPSAGTLAGPSGFEDLRAGDLRCGRQAGADQLTSATAEGLTPVLTVGVLSAVSDPSAPMAYCETVLSLMFVAYAY